MEPTPSAVTTETFDFQWFSIMVWPTLKIAYFTPENALNYRKTLLNVLVSQLLMSKGQQKIKN